MYIAFEAPLEEYIQLRKKSSCSLKQYFKKKRKSHALLVKDLKWLNGDFWGSFLTSLSISYVVINKDLEKLLPQLYENLL